MVFEVKTEHFNGPFDLLLDLIEQRKLLVNEVSLSKVTDDFISYIETQKDFPMAEGAHFILIASTLVLIKSKSLLPNLELTPDEQSDIKSLETRLAIYKRIREAGVHIQRRFDRTPLFGPSHRNFTKTVFSPNGVSRRGIIDAIQKVIAQIPRAENLPEVIVRKVISLEEMIGKLTARVEQCLKMNFREFSNGDKAEKINVIIGFLAMLELVKRGVIRVEQRTAFDDIDMETGNVNIPKYN